MAKRTYRALVGGVGLVTAIALSGCTSDSDDSDSSASTQASASSDSTSTVTTSDVVTAANAFLDTLDDDQKAEVLLDFDEENAPRGQTFPVAPRAA